MLAPGKLPLIHVGLVFEVLVVYRVEPEIRELSSRSTVSIWACKVMISAKATCVQPCCRAMISCLVVLWPSSSKAKGHVSTSMLPDSVGSQRSV